MHQTLHGFAGRPIGLFGKVLNCYEKLYRDLLLICCAMQRSLVQSHIQTIINAHNKDFNTPKCWIPQYLGFPVVAETQAPVEHAPPNMDCQNPHENGKVKRIGTNMTVTIEFLSIPCQLHAQMHLSLANGRPSSRALVLLLDGELCSRTGQDAVIQVCEWQISTLQCSNRPFLCIYYFICAWYACAA